MYKIHKLILIFFLILVISPIFATELIYIELWTELDPILLSEGESKLPVTPQEAEADLSELWKGLKPIPISEDESMMPISQETAFKNLLLEARTIISAMIYGFSFTYIPSDIQHSVKEFFEFIPIAEIPYGDKNLHVESTELADSRIYVRLSYLLEDHQMKRRQSWLSVQIPAGSGTGEGSLLKGMQEKRTALSMSLKNAVYNYLRTRIINKPREIRGEALLESNPETIIHAGTYTTTARYKINIKEIIPYTVF